MKRFLLTLSVLALLASSAFAGLRCNNEAWEEYLRAQNQLRYEQEMEDKLNEINAKLDTLDEIQARLSEIGDQ